MVVNHTKRERLARVTLIFILASFFYVDANIAKAYTPPILPQAYVDTNYPVLSSSRTIRSVKTSCTGVSNCSTSLQVAIDTAILGDEIVVDANIVSGPLVLKNKTSGSGWIIIRSAKLSELPQGNNRINPSYSTLMPKVESPGSNVHALGTEAGAHHYYIVGLEFRKVAPSAAVSDLINLGNNVNQTTLASVPHHIILDKIYAHGDPTSDLKRCIGLHSSHSAVINSHVSDCHMIGADSQAIASFNSPGPMKIINNYLEASSENVLFGGDTPRINGLISSDIEIRNNYMTKPLSWRNGTPNWSMKNVLEFKSGLRALVDGNIIENSWSDGQVGPLVVITPRKSGTATWTVTQELTFTNNIIRHGGQAFQILGYDGLSNDGLDTAVSGQAKNILFKNNLFYDVNKNWGGSHSFFFGDRPANIYFDHNTMETVDAAGEGWNTITFDSKRSDGTFDLITGLVFTNNLMTRGGNGVFGGSDGTGTTAFNTYAPGYVFTKNVTGWNTSSTSSYPPMNVCPTTCYPSLATWRSQFTNYNNAIAGDIRSFALKSDSVYRSAGTDGKDIGADISAVYNATVNVINGGQTTNFSNPQASDLNVDHIVNAIDASILSLRWFTSDFAADLNKDGTVNTLDYSILNNNWYKTW